MKAFTPLLGFVTISSLLLAANAFYLPGVAPREYANGERVDLKVNKLTSTHSALSFNNYDLPFCRPLEGVHQAAENLGEHLTGDTIENSPYELYMNVTEYCKVLCVRPYSVSDILNFRERIREGYNINWILDNLPAAATGLTMDGSVIYSRGFPIGYMDAEKAYVLYNHVRITIDYHQSDEYEGKRVVGFYVHPMSIRHDYVENHDNPTHPTLQRCPPGGFSPEETWTPMYITGGQAMQHVKVLWTYDVMWQPSDIRWPSRWDIYLSMGDRYSSEIHWFSIINSLVIVLFLTAMVAMIMVRALYRDLSRYNRVATDEEKAEDREETGWKLVHGDVFRPPANFPMLFAVFTGVGCQVTGMVAATVLFAAIGFLSPANRGSLMIALVLLFLLMGVGAGYWSARTHKMLNGVTYQRCTLLVAFGFPGFVFLVVFILNLFVWATGSVNAINFGSMFAVLILWFLISVPLVFVGAYYGFKREKITFPVATSSIPRQIPPQPWYFHDALVMAVGGILPFGAVFVEVFFILSSIWLDQYYYVYGFLLLVCLILAVTCAEISIVLIYFQLCAEDYRWWWRSALVPGSAGIYLFLYSIFYFISWLNMMDSTSVLLYFSYMFLVSLMFALCTGVIGHLATLWFTRKIYSAIKVD